MIVKNQKVLFMFLKIDFCQSGKFADSNLSQSTDVAFLYLRYTKEVRMKANYILCRSLIL